MLRSCRVSSKNVPFSIVQTQKKKVLCFVGVIYLYGIEIKVYPTKCISTDMRLLEDLADISATDPVRDQPGWPSLP